MDCVCWHCCQSSWLRSCEGVSRQHVIPLIFCIAHASPFLHLFVCCSCTLDHGARRVVIVCASLRGWNQVWGRRKGGKQFFQPGIPPASMIERRDGLVPGLGTPRRSFGRPYPPVFRRLVTWIPGIPLGNEPRKDRIGSGPLNGSSRVTIP